MSEWGSVASLYDLQLPLERPALRVAIELANPRTKDRLLDVGAGTGGILRELARRQSRPAGVVGVDVSREMLARAPTLPEGWELRLADARSLPFDDQSFDIVTAAYLLHIVDPVARREIVRECVRVLAPGGRLITVTPTAPRSPVLRWLLAALVRARGHSSGPLAGLRPLDPRPQLIDRGLSVVNVRYVRRGYPSLCVLSRRANPIPTRA